MPQLDSLGLRENPFKNNSDPRFFYADQNRAQILESTEHLIEYSSNLQVIIGASGVGKTHLLETLASRMDNNWRVAKIKEPELDDTLSLIQSILNAFGADSNEDVDVLESLETQLAEIIQLGYKPVLFIDDAQALSQDAIRFLLQLSQQQQNDEPYINIVLFATMEITEHLQGAELKDFRDVIHIATLSNMNKEGVSGYLRHKLAVVGFDRESPFTPRIIDSIYNDSHGIPEKVDFFANKFLVSSGKGDTYIEPGDTGAGNALSQQEEDLMGNLKDGELGHERSDRAEEQLHRLTEQFDEIDDMTEPSIGNVYADNKYDKQEYPDSETSEDEYDEQQPFSDFEEQEVKSFGLGKVIIPVAIAGIVIAALIVINSVFNDTKTDVQEQVDSQQIELLPLELPVESSPATAGAKISDGTQDTDGSLSAEGSLSADGSLPADGSSPAEGSQLAEGSQSAEGSQLAAGSMNRQFQTGIEQQEQQSAVVMQPKSDASLSTSTLTDTRGSEAISKMAEPEMVAKASEAKKPAMATQTDPGPVLDSESAAAIGPVSEGKPIPELVAVEPEPVIGSNQRQTITITGKNLSKDSSLIVSWADNSKEFSAQQTPEQWRYIDKNKIKLLLNTGTKSQTWQVYAKNSTGQQSKGFAFEVVKPFIAKMAIKSIAPNPVIGSDKRQAISIKGQGFSSQTVVELRWDKNSKHFSSRLSPNQFEFISANEIKLYITTGTKARKWRVIAKQTKGKVTASSSFKVIQAAQASAPSSSTLKDKNWLSQQADDNYTIQLFGSYNKQAIDDLAKKYQLTGDIAWFETQRNGRSWYSMTYGNFQSKAAANRAISSLDTQLSKPKPWIRSFENIKNQLNPGSVAGAESANILPGGQNEIRNEAWIWTRNPTDHTVQILALSKEQGVKDYAKKHQLGSKSMYFKIIRDNKPLYVLLYGDYPDKQAAQQARDQLAAKLKGTKPWIRPFSEIHSLLNP